MLKNALSSNKWKDPKVSRWCYIGQMTRCIASFLLEVKGDVLPCLLVVGAHCTVSKVWFLKAWRDKTQDLAKEIVWKLWGLAIVTIG